MLVYIDAPYQMPAYYEYELKVKDLELSAQLSASTDGNLVLEVASLNANFLLGKDKSQFAYYQVMLFHMDENNYLFLNMQYKDQRDSSVGNLNLCATNLNTNSPDLQIISERTKDENES